jgi:Family of unknown function (DUF5681)
MSRKNFKDNDRQVSSYDVGYGRPPTHSRFKPGQSGNPKGRPKGSRSPKDILEKVLTAPITVVEDGVKRTITKSEAIYKALVAYGLKGDIRAILTVVKLSEQFGLTNSNGENNKPFILYVSSDDARLA